MEIARKITLRTVGLMQSDILIALKDQEKVNLIKVAGVTTAAKTGQTDKGEYTKLLGEFIAQNLLTGEVFQSGQCILPSFLSEQLAAALNASESVEFALLIGARADKSAVTGYVYTAQPLVNAEPTARMSKLLTAAGIAPALPAPAAAEPEPEPAPAKVSKKS
jgi:hypothetical protein